ncbi:uncharacterized protein [Fopius arisanus]|uniref:RsmA_0 protein n=1 Tax=Fopius arisanus TaxID=64838 RepID=A0A0C9PNX4_9HYME|nr:PREDICTED: uncharacterized protein LOC105264363 [Fopius arisanus]
MWKSICALFGVLCLLKPGECTAHCYSEFCRNTSLSLMESQWGKSLENGSCLLTPIQNNSDCKNMKFNGLGRLPPPGVPLADFELSAYVYHERGTKITAFNLTIKDITFRKLVTRYQELVDSTSSYCRHIHFYGLNQANVKPNLFVSCPFTAEAFEERSYWLEYSIIGDNYEYSRKLLFNVPSHHHIGERVEDVRNYIPFIYVDVSDMPVLRLHIQPLPNKFNISNYRIWVINNETSTSEITKVKSLNSEEHISHNFSVSDGTHYVYVAAMHPHCGEYGCVNNSLSVITRKQPTRRILIMIISVVWIPPVILYAIYYLYKLYNRNNLFKHVTRRPKCLLVYSPTHMAHVDVVLNLANYLRSCRVAAMVDVLDIPETVTKDPGYWCNEAFKSADTIVVLASPHLGAVSVPVIYKNVDNHALRLLKENYSLRNKRYITIELPYCTYEEIPEEARLFKRLKLPENLDKLVKYLHNFEFNRCFTGPSEHLIQSIGLATMEITRERQESPKNIDETHGLLPPADSTTIATEKSEITTIETKIVSDEPKFEDHHQILQEEPPTRTYRTNIHELNLFGECEEPEEIRYRPPANISGFRIDQLNL